MCLNAGRSTLKSKETAGPSRGHSQDNRGCRLPSPPASLPLAGLTVRSKHIPQLMFGLWSGLALLLVSSALKGF